MSRVRLNVAPIFVLLVCAFSGLAYSQDLFEQYDANAKDAEMTEEKTAAGERESIF